MADSPPECPAASRFRTHDTTLAAFLYISSIPFIGTERCNDKVYFVFDPPESDPRIERLLSQFNSGAAEANILAYQRAYRKLLRMVQQQQPTGVQQ